VRVLILGSTGRIGATTNREVIAAGHDVVALVRAQPGADGPISYLAGDVTDQDAVDRAVEGTDAVIAALGPRSTTADAEEALAIGMRNVVDAMDRYDVRRLIALSGAAVEVDGDRKPFVDRVVSRVVRRFARHVVGAKQREFEIFSATDLEWTALRPPFVTDGSAAGYRLSIELTPGARVTRSDVGKALADQVASRDFIRAAPFVLPPARTRGR
jgi:nucleoside-diphosphate-sugar epimerase